MNKGVIRRELLRPASLFLLLVSLLLSNVPGGARRVSAGPEGDFYDEPGVRLLNQPVGEYRARRQKLLDEIKDGVVVILGNVEEDLGVEARYRQNNWMA